MSGSAPGHTRRTRWLFWTGIAFALLTGLLDILLTSALPVTLDLRPGIVVVGALSGALLLGSPARSAWSRRSRVLALGAGLVALASSAAAVFDLTLAYRTEEVAFTNGDVTLRGTLYLPRSGGRHPALVLIHGSGRQPRDEYRFYARMYARRGVAALAYDKRGSGLSGGSVTGSTYQVFAGDAVKAVDLLRHHHAIDPARVGIWGLSEGEWVGPAAAEMSHPAFLVLVSASAKTPANQVAHETGARVRAAGFSEDQAREASELYGRVSQFQRTGQGRDELNKALESARKEPWFAAAWYLDESVPEYERVLALPWFRPWLARMDFDALSILSRLTCPILAQTGTADPKSDGAASLERLRRAVARGTNAPFTGLAYPGAVHNVIVWPLPFHLPPPWFASGYLNDQTAWVERVVGLR